MTNRPLIRVERRAREISQAELARAAGVSQPFLSLVETGKRHPSAKTAEAIAKALELPMGRLFGAAE